MKILILGATGMAGHTISQYFIECGYDVITFTKKKCLIGKNIIGNAITFNFEELLTNNIFDVVINCIGILNKKCDKNPADAIYLNSYLPHKLANILRNTNTKLIHMSTDCVFSGIDGEYTENSIPDGQTLYDRTKALGEINDNKNLTFRNSIIGQDTNINGIGLFNWFMKQNNEINGYNNVIWTGVTTLTLAKAMKKAIEQNITGLYHLVNNENINKFDLLSLFNRHMKNNNINIISKEDVFINKSLKNTRTDFIFNVPTYEKMIIEMKEWIVEHKSIYQHYKILV
jgi:dTDP-4-dehydrorhamnose reductase